MLKSMVAPAGAVRSSGTLSTPQRAASDASRSGCSRRHSCKESCGTDARGAPATDAAAVPNSSQAASSDLQQAQTSSSQSQANTTQNAVAATSPSAAAENSAGADVSNSSTKASETAQPATDTQSSSRGKKKRVASTSLPRQGSVRVRMLGITSDGRIIYRLPSGRTRIIAPDSDQNQSVPRRHRRVPLQRDDMYAPPAQFGPDYLPYD